MHRGGEIIAPEPLDPQYKRELRRGRRVLSDSSFAELAEEIIKELGDRGAYRNGCCLFCNALRPKHNNGCIWPKIEAAHTKLVKG